MTNTPPPELLGVADICETFKLGRDLTAGLVRLMPHISLGAKGRGRQRLVRRTDFDQLIHRATEEQRDLWELVRDFTPDTLQEWLSGGARGLN